MAAGKRKLTSDAAGRSRGRTSGRRATRGSSPAPAPEPPAEEPGPDSTPYVGRRRAGAPQEPDAASANPVTPEPRPSEPLQLPPEQPEPEQPEPEQPEPEQPEPEQRREVPPPESATPPRKPRRGHGLDKPEVTELEIGQTVHKVAPDPQPLDVDGVRTMTVGSIIWLAVGLGMLPFFSTLQANGTIWWLWTCVAGFGLGLMGVEYCRRRRAALASEDDDAH